MMGCVCSLHWICLLLWWCLSHVFFFHFGPNAGTPKLNWAESAVCTGYCYFCTCIFGFDAVCHAVRRSIDGALIDKIEKRRAWLRPTKTKTEPNFALNKRAGKRQTIHSTKRLQSAVHRALFFSILLLFISISCQSVRAAPFCPIGPRQIIGLRQ